MFCFLAFVQKYFVSATSNIQSWSLTTYRLGKNLLDWSAADVEFNFKKWFFKLLSIVKKPLKGELIHYE